MNKLQSKNLFDFSNSVAKELFEKTEYPWEILPLIKEYITIIGKSLGSEYEQVKENVWIAKTAKIADNVSINGAVIIGPGTEVRHCAYIRGNVIIGANCVIGNSTEMKNVVVLDNVQLPHYNYVGDSIIGNHSHLGAGAVTSNIKSDKTNITIKYSDGINTGMRKIGAFIADDVEVGCNSVLCPGTIIAKGSSIYPLSLVRGYVPENSIVKQNIITTRRV